MVVTEDISDEHADVGERGRQLLFDLFLRHLFDLELVQLGIDRKVVQLQILLELGPGDALDYSFFSCAIVMVVLLMVHI